MPAAPSRRSIAYAGPACPRCQLTIGQPSLPSGIVRCPSCGREFEATSFEPPPTAAPVARLAQVGAQEAPACASHAGNAAVAHCDRCGILMCGLCRIAADGMALCPPCFERLSDEGALSSTRVAFRDYSRLAWTVCLLGILIFYCGIVTGPASIYCAIRGARQKRAMGEPARSWAVVLVLLLALAQTAASAWFLAFVIGGTAASGAGAR